MGYRSSTQRTAVKITLPPDLVEEMDSRRGELSRSGEVESALLERYGGGAPVRPRSGPTPPVKKAKGNAQRVGLLAADCPEVVSGGALTAALDADGFCVRCGFHPMEHRRAESLAEIAALVARESL